MNFKIFFYSIILILFDILILGLSLVIAFYIRENFFHDFLPTIKESSIYRYNWIIVITFITLFNEKIYFMRYDYWGDLKKILKGIFLSFVIVFTILSLAKISTHYSRSFLILYFTIALVLLALSKRIIKKMLFYTDFFKINVKIIATKDEYKKISSEIAKNWYFGFKNVNSDYKIVLINSKGFDFDELQHIIKEYSLSTKDIYIIPYMNHINFAHTTVIDFSNIRLSAFHIENKLLNLKNIVIKNIFEKLLIFISLPIVILLHFVIVILIKLDSKGPIFFKQKRIGKNLKLFTCYKYRTMYINNDKILKEYLLKHPEEIQYYDKYHKYKKDPRITKIGSFLRKSSLDELPQFLNVIKGNMNLIGPRPYMINELKKIDIFKKDIIFSVKPGITGLWQVSGRNNLTFNERLELDKWYVQNWSLWLDFVIFLKTIKVIFLKIGAR